jgi:hypothetical protein
MRLTIPKFILYRKPGGWQLYFAWRPLVIGNKIVWLEYVERDITHDLTYYRTRPLDIVD